MPELAEVEYFRRQWDSGLGSRVIAVASHPEMRVFRGTDVAALEKVLTGARLLGSEGHGKQMLFRFSRGASLGIHLGMSGRLRADAAGISPGKHDHLVLLQEKRSLVYWDPRMFGRLRFALGKEVPEWWRNLPPAVVSPAFTRAMLGEQLNRRRRSPVKAALLDQSLFPGVGNWMADEILWQIKMHPATRAGDLSVSQQHDLWRVSRAICRTALKTIGVDWNEPPKGWLIHRRWQKRGRCPRDGTLLDHGTIAGRTTVWCPVCQKRSQRPKRNSDTPRILSRVL
ncbi:MAG: Fpg/Nei family DNA glycosylase [Verrucomicrobia bacterium]|nr:Fpg/Nei family DNA glycosylase [Verrucomicrobiota bacterium]